VNQKFKEKALWRGQNDEFTSTEPFTPARIAECCLQKIIDLAKQFGHTALGFLIIWKWEKVH